MTDLLERPPAPPRTGGSPSLSILVEHEDAARRALIADVLTAEATEACRDWDLVFTARRHLDNRCGGVVIDAATIVEGSDEAWRLYAEILRRIAMRGLRGG